jgi:hypothetical protein
MDTSETYILQCQKATEIQAMRPVGQDFEAGDFYGTHEKIRSGEHKGEVRWMAWVAENGECGMDQRGKTDVFLPRQDQLQEMVLPTIRERYDNKVILGHTLDDIGRVANWLTDIFLMKVREHGLKSNSMEQLWLAFLMWERYQKRWDGGDWA